MQDIVGAALKRALQPADTEEGPQGAAWVAVTGFDTDALHAAARQVLPADMHAQVRIWHSTGLLQPLCSSE